MCDFCCLGGANNNNGVPVFVCTRKGRNKKEVYKGNGVPVFVLYLLVVVVVVVAAAAAAAVVVVVVV